MIGEGEPGFHKVHNVSENCIYDEVTKRIRPSFPFRTRANKDGPKDIYFHNTDMFAIPAHQETPSHEGRSYQKLLNAAKVVGEHTEKTVGRVWAKGGRGSAFYVAPNVIASASHVLQDVEPTLTTEVIAATKGFVQTDIQAIFVSLTQSETAALNEEDKKKDIKETDPSTVSIRRDITRMNDFSFGEVAAPCCEHKTYLIPYAGHIQPNMEIAVMGYPSLPSTSRLEKDTPTWFEQRRIDPGDVRAAFAELFEYKHVSVGVIGAVNDRVITTTATTLPGVSGGPVIVLDQPDTFCGIHIEGWPGLNYNMAIPVHHPNFVKSWVKHVLPDIPFPFPSKVVDYVRVHVGILESMTITNKNILSLIQAIKNG